MFENIKGVILIRKSRRADNTMAKKIYNDLQNTTQKTIVLATRTPTKNRGGGGGGSNNINETLKIFNLDKFESLKILSKHIYTMEFHSPCFMCVSFVRFLLYCSSIVRFTGTVVINMTYHLCTFRSKFYLISVLDLWFHWCYCFLYVLSPVYCFPLNYS